MDQVVRHWLQFAMSDDHDAAANGLAGAAVRDLPVAFHADDGLIASRNHQWLERCPVRQERCGSVPLWKKQEKMLECTPSNIVWRRDRTEWPCVWPPDPHGPIRLQSALWPLLLHCTVFGLKCVQMAANDSQLGLS